MEEGTEEAAHSPGENEVGITEGTATVTPMADTPIPL